MVWFKSNRSEDQLKVALRESMVQNGHSLKKEWPMKFDPTINLGHVLTAGAMLATGFLAYSTLAERVTVQERVSAERDQQTKMTLQEIKGDIRDLRSTVQQALDPKRGSS